MDHFVLYRVAAGLLFLGTLAHTLGGMLKMSSKGPGAGPEADQVLSSMKSVHFNWRGTNSSWYKFWMGNGLGVSALLLLAIANLWVLGGLDPAGIRPLLALAWVTFVSLALLSILGFEYFSPIIGSIFGLIALLTGIAATLSTMAVSALPL